MNSPSCIITACLLVLVTVTWLTTAMDDQCMVKSVVTYNTALMDRPLSQNLPNNRLVRREAIISELRRVNADVVCLQEVWIGQDVERIVDELSDMYGYSHSKMHIAGKYSHVLPDQTGPSMPACNYFDIMNFVTCSRRNKCLKRSFHQTHACLNIYCYSHFERLSQECITCTIASFQNAKAAFQHCAGVGLPVFGARTVNSPGLLILSKTRLFNAKYTDYHPYTDEVIERGYLEADTPGLGKVVCTHNTNNEPYYLEMELARRGVFKSFWEQGHSERTELISKFGNISPLILAGDFNTGDEFGPLINADLPQEYYHLARVFDNTPVSECTHCWPHENIYKSNSAAVLNSVVDHVFYKGHKAIKVQRVITPTDAILMDGLPLSDHNGVMTSFVVC